MNRTSRKPRLGLIPALAALFLLASPVEAQVVPGNQPGLRPGRRLSGPGVRPIALDEAIRMALRRSPLAIQIARASLRAAIARSTWAVR